MATINHCSDYVRHECSEEKFDVVDSTFFRIKDYINKTSICGNLGHFFVCSSQIATFLLLLLSPFAGNSSRIACRATHRDSEKNSIKLTLVDVMCHRTFYFVPLCRFTPCTSSREEKKNNEPPHEYLNKNIRHYCWHCAVAKERRQHVPM